MTNEVIRGLLKISESIPDSTRCQILDRFSQKMMDSGYGLKQIRRVILGGIKGYEKMVKRSREGGRSPHRSSGEDHPDPKGLQVISEGWKTGENLNNRKRRRKPKYEVVDDDWGLGNVEDMQRMEEEELTKSSFLKGRITECQTGKADNHQNLVRS